MPQTLFQSKKNLILIENLPMPISPELDDIIRLRQQIWESWEEGFIFKKQKEANSPGLRSPQIGAIHAVLGHWTTNIEQGIVVMPTGTGKTETMLSLLVACQISRLLVIVPSDALREQITRKFLTLGILPKDGIVLSKVKTPVVGVLKQKFEPIEEFSRFLSCCNVVIATAQILSGMNESTLLELQKSCTHLFIDEAHHGEASSWQKVRNAFQNKPVLQFTATPFRNDGKRLDGKIIFHFPLHRAQKEGYFTKINFCRILEYDPKKSDEAIARAAVDQLRKDRQAGFNHILMARAANKKRAEEVFLHYANYIEFSPVVLHSGLPPAQRERTKRAIEKLSHQIIVCVDMLGEGFDLPELKIAAFHDIRKSLPVTLQFAGRFTRTKRDEQLGEATFVANGADNYVSEEIDALYAQDPDWNELLPGLSQRFVQGEEDFQSFLLGFQKKGLNKIPWQNLRPALSTVIFKNLTDTWFPTRFQKYFDKNGRYERLIHDYNSTEKVLVVVGLLKDVVDWGHVEDIFNITWDLFIVYWDAKQNLLFIHSSDTNSLHENLADVILGNDNAQLLKGEVVFRCFHNINRFLMQNVGLSEHLGRNIRFTMRAGTDIEPALVAAIRNKSKKSFIFGTGTEGGKSVTIGTSYKGRIWSKRTGDIQEWTEWCQKIGGKLIDEGINPEDVLRGTLVPVLQSERPPVMPLYVDWASVVYSNPETRTTFITEQGIEFGLYQTELTLINPSIVGDIHFSIQSDEIELAQFELQIFPKDDSHDFQILQISPQTPLRVKDGTRTYTGVEYFDKNVPIVWFADGSSLAGNNLISLRKAPPPFLPEALIPFDWTGVDTKKESQGVTPKKVNSIQYRIIQKLIEEAEYDVIYDDDYSGEIADIVAIKQIGKTVQVKFFHLKFAKKGKVSQDIENLYQVCGQAQKSVSWVHSDARKFFDHLLRRETKRRKGIECSRLEKGSRTDLESLRESVHWNIRMEFSICIVQPGLSKSQATPEQLTLLGVTESFLMETALVQLEVICST